MFTTSLWGYVHSCSFEKFEQRLLYSLAAHVTSNGWIIRFASDLIDLIDINNSTLGSFYIVVGSLEQACQNTLNVFTNVTCFCEHGRIGDTERNLKDLGKRTSQVGLTRTGF